MVYKVIHNHMTGNHNNHCWSRTSINNGKPDCITKIFSNTSFMTQRWGIFFSMNACVIFVCFPFIRSDPYTRISLYDPVNGEITSLQTKTIKKVCVQTLYYTIHHFVRRCLTTFLYVSVFLLDIGSEVEWGILLQGKWMGIYRDPIFVTWLYCQKMSPQNERRKNYIRSPGQN